MFARPRQDNTIRYHLNSTRAANVSTYPGAERTTNITVRKIRSVMRKKYVSPLCVQKYFSCLHCNQLHVNQCNQFSGLNSLPKILFFLCHLHLPVFKIMKNTWPTILLAFLNHLSSGSLLPALIINADATASPV